MTSEAAPLALALTALLAAALVALALPQPAPALSRVGVDEYSFANDCYAVRSVASGRFVVKADDGYRLAPVRRHEAEPFYFKPPDLGRYLLYDRDGRFLAAGGGGVVAATEPSEAAEWIADQPAQDAFTLTSASADRPLTASGDELGVGAGGDPRFDFEPADGCTPYPEVEVSATGEPLTGPRPYGEMRGLLDAHMHMMAFEFLGGSAHCGRPWHRYGAPYALVDCPDHYPNGGGAVLENALAGGERPTHDPVGWPTFKDWPAPDSLTHEQSYYKWLERAWMGGLRVYVNLMVDNAVLCEVYPLKRNPCDEMETVRLEIKRIYELQDYIDAQEGGPGKGWFRIVTNPFQARRVINEGKLAVVLGIEVSRLFDCKLRNNVPQCTREQIDRQLAEVHKAGIRQMELVNKFDNALGGVAGDSGTTGPVVNTGNRYETGQYWQFETCTSGDEHAHDRNQITSTQSAEQDALFGNGFGAFVPPGTAPLYPAPPHCNVRGLTDLGAYLVRKMIRRKMIFDPDHLSVLARNQALSILESKEYSGVVSSHSWSTRDSFPRIYRLGGVVAPYAGDSEEFAHAWQDTKPMRDKRFYFGFGYGADANGFGAQGDPRTGAANPVRYPFRSFDGGVEFAKQRSGEREFDINVDGVAHYGLYPDWVQDLRMIAGDRIVEDMARGAEAYLQMWERAKGVPGPRCRSTYARFTGRGLGRVHLGDRPKQLLRRAGQPQRRPGRVWRYCVRGRKNDRAREVPVFTPGGSVGLVATTARGQRARGISKGMPAKRLRGRAERGAKRLWTTGAGKRGAEIVYTVRKGRISSISLASRKVAKSAKRLRRYLKLAGVA